jgi:hypothetical protein
MASTLYIGFDRDDGLPNRRKEAELATADLDRVSVAYAHIYFPEGVTEEDGTIRMPTGEEVFEKLVAGLLNGMLANTLSVEREMAAKAAKEQVADIPAVIK